MHGTSGQYRLDMKRDDARTLMLKMDARLTYAGRERNVALQMEGERQMKHIEWQRQLNQADFKREEKEMRRRMDFFQSLLEENRLERQTTLTEVNVFETEIEAEREAATRRRRRRLPPVRRTALHLDRAENVRSVRREQQSFTNNRAHQRHRNRSLNELNASYKKRQTQKELNEAKLMKIRDEMATIGKPKPLSTNKATQSTLDDVQELQVSVAEPIPSKSRKQSQPLTKSMPELPKVRESDLTPQARRVSKSQRLTSEDMDRLGKLPGIASSGGDTKQDVNRGSLGSNFYIDTSHSQNALRGRRGSISLVTLNKPKVQPKKEKPKTGLIGSLPLTNALPSHFYEGVYEDNPFLTPDFKPEAARVRKKSSKSDAMFAWLGLESMDELVLLRGEDGIGVGKDITEEDEMEWMEIESNSDYGDDDISDNAHRPKKREKRIYSVGTPVDLNQKDNPLKKFARAAKMLMLIRKLQDSAGCLPETARIAVRKTTVDETGAETVTHKPIAIVRTDTQIAITEETDDQTNS